MPEEIKKGISRRSFFKWSGLSFFSMMVWSKIRPSVSSANVGHVKNYWNDQGYFHQTNVDISKIDQGIIRAKLRYEDWCTYNVVATEAGFINWNFTERINRIDKMIGGTMPAFGGAHNPFVASFGGVLPEDDDWNRSQFSLNNAVKGMGLAPKKEYIDSIIQGLYDHWDDSEDDRLLHLKAIYSNRDLWDMSKQVSLELYATPTKLTHSFRNWMENPIANIGFMALEMQFAPPPPKLPTYELRCVAHMIHPLDPNIDEYEMKLTKFSNTVHDFYHHTPGQLPPTPSEMNIGVIHYVCEEFDNYWGSSAQSKRVAMLRVLDWTKNMYAKVFGKTAELFAKVTGTSRIA